MTEEIDTTRLEELATVAQHYDERDFWHKETFRFKHEEIGMSALLTLSNNGYIEEDDTWRSSTTTWTYTEHGREIIDAVDGTVLPELDDEQIRLVKRDTNTLAALPRDSEFRARDFDLIGQQLRYLSKCGFIEKTQDVIGEPAVWQTTTLADEVVAAACVYSSSTNTN